MRSGQKIVARYALAIGAVIGLQAFPLTGLIVMILLGTFWIAVLLNMMLLHLTATASLGSISRWWLVVPVASYAGWGTYAAIDYRQAVAVKQSISANNERLAKLPADENDFVIVSDSNRHGSPLARNFAAVLETANIYAADRVYVRVRDDRCKVPIEAEGIRVHGHLVTPDRTKSPSATGAVDKRRDGWCIISVPAEMPPSAIRVNVRYDKADDAAARTRYGMSLSFDRVAADGTHVPMGNTYHGAILYLAPFPFFQGGCFYRIVGGLQCGSRVQRLGLWVGDAGELGLLHRELDQVVYIARILGAPHL